MTNEILLVLAGAAVLFAIGGRMMMMGNNSNVKNVTAEEAKQLINENKELLILDVRTKGEYAGGHINGAKLIPVTELDSRIAELQEYVEKPILVYCASGGRSPGAVRTLVKNNFTNIFHMNRGISSWSYGVKK